MAELQSPPIFTDKLHYLLISAISVYSTIIVTLSLLSTTFCGAANSVLVTANIGRVLELATVLLLPHDTARNRNRALQYYTTARVGLGWLIPQPRISDIPSVITCEEAMSDILFIITCADTTISDIPLVITCAEAIIIKYALGNNVCRYDDIRYTLGNNGTYRYKDRFPDSRASDGIVLFTPTKLDTRARLAQGRGLMCHVAGLVTGYMTGSVCKHER
ncbi:hypothetical protein J6590_038291 [Homalodisca vitripennis]|nr:hypothetical protein J6590_038291 [Homalodisca vitripennis]